MLVKDNDDCRQLFANLAFPNSHQYSFGRFQTILTVLFQPVPQKFCINRSIYRQPVLFCRNFLADEKQFAAAFI
jgi:hypothetical protein